MSIETRDSPSMTFCWAAVALSPDPLGEALIIGWVRTQRDAKKLCESSGHISVGVLRMERINTKHVWR